MRPLLKDGGGGPRCQGRAGEPLAAVEFSPHPLDSVARDVGMFSAPIPVPAPEARHAPHRPAARGHTGRDERVLGQKADERNFLAWFMELTPACTCRGRDAALAADK
jgi:hypothetical protein